MRYTLMTALVRGAGLGGPKAALPQEVIRGFIDDEEVRL